MSSSYTEQVGQLMARILANVDLTSMSSDARVDLMTAIQELATLNPPDAQPGVTMPSTAVRAPDCVPDGIGVCAAAFLEEGLSHCCNNPAPGHGGDHQCRCGHSWGEVAAVQVAGACGVAHQAEGTDHVCECRLEVHNTVPCPDLIERPLHACVHCGGSWVA